MPGQVHLDWAILRIQDSRQNNTFHKLILSQLYHIPTIKGYVSSPSISFSKIPNNIKYSKETGPKKLVSANEIIII